MDQMPVPIAPAPHSSQTARVQPPAAVTRPARSSAAYDAKHGDQHRKRHERVVVRANQVHGSHFTPSGCHAEQTRRASFKINRLPSSSAEGDITACLTDACA